MTFASKVGIHNEAVGEKVIRKTLWAIGIGFIPVHSIIEKDWQKVIQNLLHPFLYGGCKDLNEFTLINSELYFWGSGGVLARAIFEANAQEELKSIQNLSCGNNNITLYMPSRRQDYYWPKMASYASNIQRDCSKYPESLDVDLLFMQEVQDWR